MKSNIIAFSGAHGTGKTTAVYDLAAKLKKNGVNVGIITETARECPFPVMSSGCHVPPEYSQLWIFNRQMQAEIEAEVADALEFGLASEVPSLDELRRDVFAEEMPA